MNITFVGNCQTVSLCFYFQQLLNSNEYNVSWVLYGEEVIVHLNSWSQKCKNKILDYHESIQQIEDSDIIVYQSINPEKSTFSNTKTLQEIKKKSCKLIQIPSTYLIYYDFENSIQELISRENKNNVDIKVSEIFMKFRNENIMLSCCHPSTFLFLEIMKIICEMIGLNFFTEDMYYHFMQNPNYMELP